MEITYSTDDVEASQRFAYWHEVMCRHCIPASSRMLAPGPFKGRLAVSSLGALGLSTVSASSHHWIRDARHLRSAPDDDFWVGLLCEGEGHLSQNGGHAGLRAGDMVLYDAARPFESSGFAHRLYLARIPRSSLQRRFAAAEHCTARAFNPALPGVSPLRTMMVQAASAALAGHGGAADRFGSTLIDLLAVTLEFQKDGLHGPATDRGLHGRLMAYIRRNFEDPSLSLETIAEAHHVSTRTVTRAFARHDRTAMDIVWAMRLEASRNALIEGRADSVTDAALRSGFSSLSHFSRAFRRAYGCPPHTLLRRR